MMQNDHTSEKVYSAGGVNKQFMVWVTVFLLLVGIIAGGLLTNRLAIAFGLNSKAAVIPQVCTIHDIAEFNEGVVLEGGLDKLIGDIANRSGNENDVNCTFMQYIHFYDSRQWSGAIEKGNRVLELVESGQSIDNRIDAVQSVRLIGDRIGDVKSLTDGRAEDDSIEQ